MELREKLKGAKEWLIHKKAFGWGFVLDVAKIVLLVGFAVHTALGMKKEYVDREEKENGDS